MTTKTKTPTVLEDSSLEAAHGGADSLHLLAQVSQIKAQDSSARTASTANNKGIIAILIGL